MRPNVYYVKRCRGWRTLREPPLVHHLPGLGDEIEDYVREPLPWRPCLPQSRPRRRARSVRTASPRARGQPASADGPAPAAGPSHSSLGEGERGARAVLATEVQP